MNGASFCNVINKKHLVQSIPSITPGNQKWKGAAPIFINNALEIKYGVPLSIKKSVISVDITATRNKIEAIA